MSNVQGPGLSGQSLLPLVAVIAIALGALCMWKVHQASAPGPVLAVNGPQAPEEFVPKQLTYELDGDLGDGGLLSYIDIDGHPHTVDLSTLPWSTPTTTLTSSPAASRRRSMAVRCTAECW